MGKVPHLFDFKKIDANLPFTCLLLPHKNTYSLPVVALLGETAFLGTAEAEGPSWTSLNKQYPWPLMGGH